MREIISSRKMEPTQNYSTFTFCSLIEMTRDTDEASFFNFFWKVSAAATAVTAESFSCQENPLLRKIYVVRERKT